ncbi:MAG: hypothetical protein EXS69_00245 [Candidatus Zambryskibacteria bacterium]|nr:hypothetical protein [Candidatus Zambryskibacteria bacterium]
MANIQFEQEKYGSDFLHQDAASPWFIRIIFNMGITNSDVVANIISITIAIALIVFSTMFYLRNRPQTEMPQHFKDLPTYQQSIYTTFYE